MKISNQSLHYRFNKLVQGNNFVDRVYGKRFTTCSYVRTTLFSLMKGGVNCLLFLILACFAVFVVGSAVGVPLIIMFSTYVPADPFIGVCGIIWVLVVLFLLNSLFGQIRKRMKDSFRRYEPNVFVQAIRDKHNKFCTRVEVAE